MCENKPNVIFSQYNINIDCDVRHYLFPILSILKVETEYYQRILDEEDYPKPDPPEDFDEASAKDQIKAKFMNIRRRPGEAKLYPELTSTMTVSPASDCPRGEQQRREEVSRCKVCIKVLFNNKEVSRTGTRSVIVKSSEMNYLDSLEIGIILKREEVSMGKIPSHSTKKSSTL